MPLLEVAGLSKRFGGFVALDGIDLTVTEGERVGLIGPNGSGKSTLVNCICGTLANETGTVHFDGRPVDGLLTHERTRRGMTRSFQLPRPFVTLTVADNVRVPLLYTVNARRGHALKPDELDARCAELLQLVSLFDKAAILPRDLTQVDRRRSHGRTVAIGSGRHCRAADPAQRTRDHHHSDRAHHARGDAIFAAARRPGLG
jgi:branched-chain amino acid transport system ATP-binding protein